MDNNARVDIVIVFLGNAYVASGEIFSELSHDGVSFVYEATDLPIAQKLEFVKQQSAHYAMFVGNKEIESGVYGLKNLISGKESKHSIQRIVSIVKDHRANQDFKKPI
jgi:histidyl-tRNA synthetase